MGSVDANASREASERNKKPSNGFDLASLASRRRGDLNRDENRMYPAIDLTADDAVGGGGGGSRGEARRNRFAGGRGQSGSDDDGDDDDDGGDDDDDVLSDMGSEDA